MLLHPYMWSGLVWGQEGEIGSWIIYCNKQYKVESKLNKLRSVFIAVVCFRFCRSLLHLKAWLKQAQDTATELAGVTVTLAGDPINL